MRTETGGLSSKEAVVRILALAVVVAFLVAGCKKDGSSTSAVSTNGDESHHPDVIFESPIPEETGVLPTAVVTAIFDDPMDPLTITTGTFILHDGGGMPVAGTVTYTATTRTATFTPTALLMPSMTYTASLSAYIQNTSGESLGVSHAWWFITAP
ncbi:MAG: hypothetical protein FD180_4678 [Planctomycetota bacterium]|nr:MAG: hypothetical protein FD180_4678 [Planctomycetota bacterium]